MSNYGSVIDDKSFIYMLNQVQTELHYGKSVSLDIFSTGNTINMNSTNPNLYSSVSTSNWGEGGGHAVFITSMDNRGFYVSSWGGEYLIPFEDLKNGGVFKIYSADIR